MSWAGWKGWAGWERGAGDGMDRYAVFLDEFDQTDLGVENLLKAPDDLTNTTYWTHSGVSSVVDEGGGVFKVTSTGGAAAISQYLTNWFPEWAGQISWVVEVLKGTRTNINLGIESDGPAWVTLDSYEVLSGPGTLSGVSLLLLQDLSETVWTKVRLSGSVKGWASLVRPCSYLGDAGSNPGDYTYYRNWQVIIGDQPSEKPRPVGQETAYPMMAYRPNWRLTKDGKARAAVADTDGLIWNGEATDIKIAPTSNNTYDCDANGFVTFTFTRETASYVNLQFRHVDVTDTVRVYVETTSGTIYLQYLDGSTNTVWSDTGLFSDGVFYRLTVTFDGSTVKLYLDDALLTTETITHNQTVALGRQLHTLATNDLRIVAESNPKAPGLIIAGGTAAYNECDIYWTEPDGGAFDLAASSAMLVTLTSHDNTGDLRFGIEAGMTPPVTGALSWYTFGATIQGGGLTDGIDDLVEGVERSFMAMKRSATGGFHYFDHDSDKEWKRNHATLQDFGTTGYLGLTNYSRAYSAKRVALLDLSSWVERDFVEVTDSGSVWAGLDHEMSFHATAQLTTPTPWTVNQNCHYFMDPDTTPSWLWQFKISGLLSLMYRATGGSYSTKASLGGVFAADTVYQIDFTYNDNTKLHRCYVDGVLKISYIDSENLDKNGPRTATDGNEYCDSVTIHPYPALGLAQNRIINPQSGQEFECPSDFLSIFRAITLPLVDSNYFFFRGTNPVAVPYCYGIRFRDDGRLYIFDFETSTTVYESALGALSDDDDVMLLVDGTLIEEWINSISEDSFNGADKLTNTGMKNRATAAFVEWTPTDAVEIWKPTETLPFKL